MSTPWTLVVITGSSRGLGRALALSFAKHSSSPLELVLSGRSSTGLKETQNLVESVAVGKQIELKTVLADLTQIKSLETVAENLFSLNPGRTYDTFTLISNAGSLGPIGRVESIESLVELDDAFDLNVTSACFLTSKFVKRFLGHENLKKLHLVNISTLCAIEPFETMAIYCAAKAAREMYHKVLAKENATNPRVRVLNYSPGPVDTEMQADVRGTANTDQNIRDYYSNLFVNGKLVTPEESAEKFLRVYTRDSYVSGANFDYYDPEDDHPVGAKKACSNPNCGCKENCKCGEECSCRKSTEVTPDVCTNANCPCGSDCLCGSTCTCSSPSGTKVVTY